MLPRRIAKSLPVSSARRTQLQKVAAWRSFATATSDPNYVNIVEVGPRDGLQNEKSVIPPEVKVDLINRLGRAGMKVVEAGSFVSPKWVPQVRTSTPLIGTSAESVWNVQMAGTADVLVGMERLPGHRYPVLVPNVKGLELLLDLLAKHPSSSSTPPLTDEIAIFTAATDAFCKANTNCTIAESLQRLEPVARRARKNGLRVRG